MIGAPSPAQPCLLWVSRRYLITELNSTSRINVANDWKVLTIWCVENPPVLLRVLCACTCACPHVRVRDHVCLHLRVQSLVCACVLYAACPCESPPPKRDVTNVYLWIALLQVGASRPGLGMVVVVGILL